MISSSVVSPGHSSATGEEGALASWKRAFNVSETGSSDSRTARTTSASRRTSVSTGADSSARAARIRAKPFVLGYAQSATCCKCRSVVCSMDTHQHIPSSCDNAPDHTSVFAPWCCGHTIHIFQISFQCTIIALTARYVELICRPTDALPPRCHSILPPFSSQDALVYTDVLQSPRTWWGFRLRTSH